MDAKKDYYAILGVSKTATREEINAAFRKKAMECHPDRFTDEKEKETAKSKFQMVNEAHDILCDETKRQMYDSECTSGYSSGYSSSSNYTNPFENINSEIFTGTAPAYNADFANLYHAMYGGSSSAPKTTDEILQRKRG